MSTIQGEQLIELCKKLDQNVGQVALIAGDRRRGREQERSAEAELLLLAIEIAKPMLPAVCSTWYDTKQERRQGIPIVSTPAIWLDVEGAIWTAAGHRITTADLLEHINLLQAVERIGEHFERFITGRASFRARQSHHRAAKLRALSLILRG